MRKIVYVTGSRAEYGVIRSTLEEIQKHRDLKLSLIVTGMHLSPEFGGTVNEIEKDGFKIDAKIDILPREDTGAAMAKYLGSGVICITEALGKIKPDIVLLAGDRSETLAAAIAAAYLNIPVAHMSGGDITTGGTIDDIARHCITKFAHIHFPATEKSAKMIINMGEHPSRVFAVGNPGIPLKYKASKKELERVARQLKLDLTKPILLVIQHPVTTESHLAGRQMRETMEAIKELRMQTVVIYPNADAGAREMIKVINKYRGLPFVQIHKSITRNIFLPLMAISSVIMGNSSCALIEAPSFNLPAVNIGRRQEGRERGINVIDVKTKKEEIIPAVRKALYNKKFREQVKKSMSPYVKRGAEKNIVKILRKIEVSPKLLRKSLFLRKDVRS